MHTKKEEFEIPFTEDLMREHGILNRILLIYEEIIKRITNSTEFPLELFEQAVAIIKSFIEDYHEKMEEEYIFPIFEKHKKEVRLVKTLKNQHTKGREITAQVQKLIQGPLDQKNKSVLKNLLQKFIRMYRPHEAREDTELFPLVRSLITEQEFKMLSEKFEDSEHELFGKTGFQTILKKVEDIEKELGIFNLEQFTPKFKE
jgi:hemerythrin-like domain-containing protein